MYEVIRNLFSKENRNVIKYLKNETIIFYVYFFVLNCH